MEINRGGRRGTLMKGPENSIELQIDLLTDKYRIKVRLYSLLLHPLRLIFSPAGFGSARLGNGKELGPGLTN
jgi:hypothetical protein